MQPVCLWILWGRQFEDENTQWKKSNKCNQCEYASFQAGSLKKHLKRHHADKVNKCNQCDFAYSGVSQLRKHFNTHVQERPKMQPVWLCVLLKRRLDDSLKKRAMEKRQPNRQCFLNKSMNYFIHSRFAATWMQLDLKVKSL